MLVVARHRSQAQLLFVEVGAITTREGHADQPPFVAVGPAVVRAAEELSVATLVSTNRRAPMATAVEERPDLTIATATYHDLLAPDPLGAVITSLGNFGLVREIDPVSVEDPLQLGFEDVLRGEHSGVNPFLLDQGCVAHVLAHLNRHVHPSRRSDARTRSRRGKDSDLFLSYVRPSSSRSKCVHYTQLRSIARVTHGASRRGVEADMTATPDASLAGTIKLGEYTVNRLGFGAMRITGQGVWGDPADPKVAISVLRHAVEWGVNFIDTADSYGPEVS